MSKTYVAVTLYVVSIILMIGLIPFVTNDYVLALIYFVFILALMLTKSEEYDLAALFLGLIGIGLSEYFFISTGVEKFVRDSLFGVMPLWLPLLWAYVFVTIKRSLRILTR